MVPRKGGEAMNQTEPDAYGIHDNPVSGSHPPGIVTLTSQGKHKSCHMHVLTKARGRGGPGIKSV